MIVYVKFHKHSYFQTVLCFQKFSCQATNKVGLAAQLGTDSTDLLQVIYEYKGVNFNKYLSQPRIHYITSLLIENRKYLLYMIETLTKEWGIASRQNFSDPFMRSAVSAPRSLLKNRMQEPGDEK